MKKDIPGDAMSARPILSRFFSIAFAFAACGGEDAHASGKEPRSPFPGMAELCSIEIHGGGVYLRNPRQNGATFMPAIFRGEDGIAIHDAFVSNRAAALGFRGKSPESEVWTVWISNPLRKCFWVYLVVGDIPAIPARSFDPWPVSPKLTSIQDEK
ncbi:MAG: hypothetical protein ING19_17210 [Azospirillum sp.]|nr:hypothetical protein [Azospirillum sp.]